MKRFGTRIGVLTVLFMGTSCGMFHASVAYLPSTFSMYMVMAGYAAWLKGERYTTDLDLYCRVLH